MDITVRTARPEEYPRIGDLTARVYLDGGLLEGPDDPYQQQLRDAATRARDAELLAAVDTDGTVLGSVTLATQGRYAEISGAAEAEFRMLAVDPAARGRGVGEALVRGCVSRASALGRERLLLSTLSVMHDAHRLYRRLGFVRVPERDWSPFPQDPDPLLVFGLDLATEGAAHRGH